MGAITNPNALGGWGTLGGKVGTPYPLSTGARGTPSTSSTL